ncbi:MAG: glycosyltransferase family 2 protein [bacterium]|nr:glycosyltransferase family 2 protein [bacterium]
MYDIVTVTVNYKMKDKVLAMLRSLFSDVEGSGLKIKAVVIDNASLDGLEQELAEKFPQVECVVNSRNLGFGAANNIALRKYESKYFFLVNPDIVFPVGRKSCQKLYEFMEGQPKIGLVAPKLVLASGAVQLSCLRFPGFWDQPFYRLEFQKRYDWAKRKIDKLLMSDFNHDKVLPVDWATGAAIFIRFQALRQVGFFDERYFMYFEDCDLCRRFWEAGWPVYYKGDVALEHGYERASAKIPGVKSVFQNKLTRIHLNSLMKYWWKWRNIQAD